MTDADRKILQAIDKRKADKDDLCVSCEGSGVYEAAPCLDCLGQGVLLFQEEYNALLLIAGQLNDDILDSEIVE
jgi:hypothetical protein